MSHDKTRYLTCKKCGWVHFGVSRQFAIKEVHKFNAYFESLTLQERKKNYGNKPASLLGNYGLCFCCRNTNANMRNITTKELDAIRGSTVQPIVFPEEKII
jgi:predicted nucleic-acid-binding Zn-ribbon protein